MAGTKIAFLYSEVAGYFMACVQSLSQQAEVLVIRWPTNAEAPFEFEKSDQLNVLKKSDYTVPQLKELLTEFSPDIVVCSGWMDKDYLKLVKGLNKDVKRVLSLDNHWNGTLKQKIAAFISPFYLKKIFTHAWVPGSPQVEYAKKLGFGSQIIRGFYCANSALFNQKFEETFGEKKKKFPKRFLYVGRYVDHKGVFELWEAFIQLQKEKPNDWELWCLGTGDQWENRVKHDKIKHFGFVQPADLNQYISDTGVYILPSKFEPWGVSVQEFAIAGFPLLLSDEIGAKEQFLNTNGLSFEAGSIEAIKKAMHQIIAMNEKELIEKGEASHNIGMSYTTDQWAERILEVKRK
ncbi:MAG: glycosyltransferase involved in cell wall biosynthesis [Crocinitomix sp.]|jgi:glycosyltransferase involved in cell wall biosynthesis